MPDAFYIADADDDEGFSFADFVARIGVSVEAPATFCFDGRGNLAAAWEIWKDLWFAPHLAPAFVAAYLGGAEYRINEVHATDTFLDTRLTAELGRRSRLAARNFMEGKSEMRGHREWKRFVDGVESGASPGHVTVLFALQCALFRLPLIPALTAYAWFEFTAGAKGCAGIPRERQREIFNTVLRQVAVAVSGESDDDTAGPGTLRAI